MITVNLPDGSKAQFPDGTPQDVMQKAIQAKFPPQGYDATPVAQGLSGVNEGIANVLGFPVDATNAALRAGAAGLKAVGGPDIELPVNTIGGSASIKQLMGGAIKPEAGGGTGQVVRRIGQEVGASLVPGLGIAAKAARPAAALARQGAAALASGGGAAALDRVFPNNPYADLAGQILGFGAFGGLTKAAQRAITPFPVTPQRAAVNKMLENEGVTLTAGQKTGNEGLKYAESELGGGKAQVLTEQQREQFTSAALAKAGIGARRATPDVMAQAFAESSDEFKRLASQNVIIPDRQFGADVAQALNRYKFVVSKSNRAPAIQHTVDDIVTAVQTGRITGDQYADMRARLNGIGRRMARTDPSLSDAAFGLQQALDNAMERSIARTNPQDLGAYQALRQDYRNMLVIEDAASRAGADTADGLISPANLRSAVLRQNKRAYVTGKRDLGNLARAGVSAMTPLPQSGTAPRQAVRALGTGIPSVIGAVAGNTAGGLPGAVAGSAAGAALPFAVGRAMLSGPGRAYLSNQLLPGSLGLGQAALGPASSAAANQLNAVKTPDISLLRALAFSR